MKRDMELVRQLLKEIEAGNLNPSVDGFDKNEVYFHLHLMKERGLIEADSRHSMSGPLADVPTFVRVRRLTWDGHDLIDSISSDTKWAKVKDFLKGAGKDLTIETIKFAAKELFGVG